MLAIRCHCVLLFIVVKAVTRRCISDDWEMRCRLACSWWQRLMGRSESGGTTRIGAPRGLPLPGRYYVLRSLMLSHLSILIKSHSARESAFGAKPSAITHCCWAKPSRTVGLSHMQPPQLGTFSHSVQDDVRCL